MDLKDTSEFASLLNSSTDAQPDAEGIETRGEELPGEFQQVLGRLERTLESEPAAMHCFHRVLLQVDDERKDCRVELFSYRSVDDDSPEFSLVFRMPWETHAKHRLLQAISKCSTVWKLSLHQLTLDELEAVLGETSTQSNRVLKEVGVYNPRQPASTSAADIERIRVTLGRILQTSSTLDTLCLGNKPASFILSASCARHLALGLHANPKSALTRLDVGKLENSSVATQVAEIVRVAPRLQKLQIFDVGVLEDDAVDALGKSLAQSQTLRVLTLGGLKRGGSALLSRVFIGESCNRTIASLRLSKMEGMGDFLPLLLSSTVNSLKHVAMVYWMRELSINQWQNLGHSIHRNLSLERFQFPVPGSNSRSRWVESIEALLSATDANRTRTELFLSSPRRDYDDQPWLRSLATWESTRDISHGAEDPLCMDDEKKTILEIHLTSEADHVAGVPELWTTLANAVDSKAMSLSSLHLQLAPWLGKGSQEVGGFLEALQNTSTMQKLAIERGDGKHWPGGWKRLFDCLRYNTTTTDLEMLDCNDLGDDVFKDLMAVLQVNGTLKRINVEGSEWNTDGKV